MIIEFTCKDKKTNCTYKQWDLYKGYFAIRTINHIKKIINEYLTNTNNINDINHTDSSHFEDLNVIINFFTDEYMENIDLNDQKQYEIFYKKCTNVFKSFNDTLIYFNIGGINIILEKVNYEGSFSVGNSYDIIMLFNRIIENIKEDFEIQKSFVIELYELCIYSVKEQHKILIS